jgi:transglutaminase-like putative cysteine protease
VAVNTSAISAPARTHTGWRASLGKLPRETRDTLFLLAVIAWTVLPHLSHLPLWCGVLTGSVLLWRARLAMVNGPLPGRWVLVAVLLLAGGLTLWSFRTLLGKEPGITMTVALMALKTLELRARRDAFVVFFLGFFLILTHFLYSQSLLVAAAMLISVWGLLTALVLAHMPVGQPALKQAGALAGRTALLGAPIMVLLFMLFPRIGPLWGVPQDGLSTTGLSNIMRMGSVAQVAQDDSVAMRIRFLDRVPPPEARYFRGPVLSRFDGVEWRPLLSGFRATLSSEPNLRVRGDPIRYEMTLEPLKLTVLPLLEAATEAPQVEGLRISPRDDLRWVAQRPVTERLRFTAQAHIEFRHGPAASAIGLQDHLELPPGYNPRTLAWAAALRRDPRYAQASAEELARILFMYIRTQGFSYTLAPGAYGEQDPRGAVDEFWLDRKAGFCEHFAAAFVVIMRALGIPARIVTGYQGTDPVPVDGYYIVRQSSAHAWAEYWQAGVGWVRADPTAFVAPDRIARSRNLAPPPGVVSNALRSVSPALLTQLRNAWETVNNRWNQWVLNYSRGQQLNLLEKLGFSSPSWQDLALLLIGILSTLALAGAGWAWWDRHRIDPWTRQMQRMRAALRSLGVAAAEHEAPRTLAQRLREQFGEPARTLAEHLETLDAQRYSRQALARPDPAWTRNFVLAARALARQGR